MSFQLPVWPDNSLILVILGKWVEHFLLPFFRASLSFLWTDSSPSSDQLFNNLSGDYWHNISNFL